MHVFYRLSSTFPCKRTNDLEMLFWIEFAINLLVCVLQCVIHDVLQDLNNFLGFIRECCPLSLLFFISSISSSSELLGEDMWRLRLGPGSPGHSYNPVYPLTSMFTRTCKKMFYLTYGALQVLGHCLRVVLPARINKNALFITQSLISGVSELPLIHPTAIILS